MMSRAPSFALALVLASTFLATPPASADPPGGKAVYVLSVWTNDADDQADALTKALRARMRQTPGWSLAETGQSFETLAIALRCPPTPNQACLERIGDQIHADRYVWGTMAKEKPGEVTADMRLWSRGSPQAEASESYADSLKDANDDALRAVAGRLVAKLTSQAGGGAAAGSAPPSAAADGSGKDASGASDASTATEEPADHKSFPVRRTLGYVGLGLGAAALVASGVELIGWMNDKSDSNTDRQNVPSNVTDVCATPSNASYYPSAQDACQKSKDAANASQLGWIFLGVGAVLAGTGAWLVLGDHHASDGASGSSSAATTRPHVGVLPAFGPRGGALDVRVTF
jgi:hypothetical protein